MGGEERGPIVEDEVDLDVISLQGSLGTINTEPGTYAGELLKALKKATSHEPLAQSAFEAVQVGGFADAELVFVVGVDLGQLLDQCRMVDVKSSKTRERFGRLFVFALFDAKARGLW